MSYILDALKKSEQQRQAVQPGSVTDRLLVNQPEARPKARKGWVILLFGNLVAIAALFWYLGQHKLPPAPAGQQATVQAANPVSPAPVAGPAGMIAQAPSIQADEVQPSASPSIAQMMEPAQPAAPVKAAARPAKPAADKKPVTAKKRQTLTGDEHYAYSRSDGYPQEPARTEPAPEYHAPREEWSPPANPTSASAKPKLAINVLGYTQNPNERFVIINMTKYKVGQLINGDMQLKAIHPDHVVLQQGNVSFKVERP